MLPTLHTHLARTAYVTLCAAAVLLAQLAMAQTIESQRLSDDSLEYFLVQAFQASKAEDRLALNHIGIEATATDGGYLVTAALEGYPAHQAGIERGDKIIELDGAPFHPVYSFNSRGFIFKRSTGKHLLEFERSGNTETVEITPVFENLYDSYRSATLNSVQEFSLGNKTISYIRFWGLSRSTSDLFTLEQIMRSFAGSDGMIVDLRNSFGYLSSTHLDLFARNGRGYFDASGSSNRHAAIMQGFPIATSRPFTKPIVVLVNSETRGGAELLAYGLSKLGRITTLGQNSPGRIGSYSSSDASLEYSSAEETLIDGQGFETIGVVPKEVIPFPFTQSSRSDPQFESAVDILLGII